MTRPRLVSWLSALAAAAFVATTSAATQPTRADVAYGDHERQVFDFYAAKSKQPAPVAFFYHGGGFTGGDKSKINQKTLKSLLKSGISVVAVNYRFVKHARLPAAFHDGARALQYVRAHAEDFSIDPTRVAVFGGSAGAQIATYIAFHDDLADPQSEDPVARQSTRVTCVATAIGQATIDPEWMMKWIPGYDKPDRDVGRMFGVTGREALLHELSDITALSLASADDPPIFMSYRTPPDDPIPADPKKRTNWQVHHVIFGIKLKERLDALGVESHLAYPGAKSAFRDSVAFMKAKLRP